MRVYERVYDTLINPLKGFAIRCIFINPFFVFYSTDIFYSEPDRISAIELKNEIKARDVMTDESTSSILHSALHIYPLSAAGELPKNEALMLVIRRQRTVETVDVDGRLLEKYRKTYRDEDLILHEDKFNYLYNQY